MESQLPFRVSLWGRFGDQLGGESDGRQGGQVGGGRVGTEGLEEGAVPGCLGSGAGNWGGGRLLEGEQEAARAAAGAAVLGQGFLELRCFYYFSWLLFSRIQFGFYYKIN